MGIDNAGRRGWTTILVAGLAVSGCSDASSEADQERSAWERAAEENEAGKADDNGCSGVLVPDRNGFGKRVALTFDDGPNPTTTPKVLDILARHDIRATFFINGSRVSSDAHRAVLTRIVDEGHILANHSHRHKNLSTLSGDSVDNEIRQTHEIIAGFVDAPRFFRFPFGASTCGTARQVRDFDLVVTGWHVDSADWCYAKGTGGVGFCHPDTFKWVPDQHRDDMVGYTVGQVQAKGGGVVLFHDIHANTVANLEPIIERLEGDGFTFTNVDDVGVFPQLNGQDDPRGWIGDPCGDDVPDVCNFEVASGLGECEIFGEDGLGFCTVECDGFCPDRTGAPGTFCTSLDDGMSGNCVVQADPDNGNCEDIPGMTAVSADRHIGNSSASAATATVCLPGGTDAASCAGLCGTSTPVGSNPVCFCDETCADRDDCCGDFDALCR